MFKSLNHVRFAFDFDFLQYPPSSSSITHISALFLPSSPVSISEAEIIYLSGYKYEKTQFMESCRLRRKEKSTILGFTPLENNDFMVVENVPIHQEWFGVEGLVYAEQDCILSLADIKTSLKRMPNTVVARVYFECTGHEYGRKLLPENPNLPGFYGPLLITARAIVDTTHGFHQLDIPLRFAIDNQIMK